MKFKIINKPSEAVLKIAESVKKIGIEKGFDYTDNDADFVIAIGGDGTLLRAIREGKPIVGVKAGRRGFLMDVPKERIGEVFDRIRRGDFKEEKYILLEGEFNGKKVKAFNEIGVMFDRPEAIQVQAKFGRNEILIEGDGILVSTPQGSSGWSMSITRNLVSKNLEALEIVFVNPIYQPLRSLVIELSPITLKMLNKGYIQTARVVADGEIFSLMKSCEEMTVKPAEEKARLMRFFELDMIRESLWTR
ncbi:NAD(+)/NADH kinase [Sulfuracidifex metallicus]|uniref:NAD(+)/NADH kinase n=1 Tax=Sulfuracidifex metallicus TaxID=47303 RepID=UPI002275AB63|nr:NAD(+)/NADH kinase [Sulfuracidifex metallicus]MCY0849467.1 NAD(+)/NADH kinase [Sulfuracidifex metallicus]